MQNYQSNIVEKAARTLTTVNPAQFLGFGKIFPYAKLRLESDRYITQFVAKIL